MLRVNMTPNSYHDGRGNRRPNIEDLCQNEGATNRCETTESPENNSKNKAFFERENIEDAEVRPGRCFEDSVQEGNKVKNNEQLCEGKKTLRDDNDKCCICDFQNPNLASVKQDLAPVEVKLKSKETERELTVDDQRANGPHSYADADELTKGRPPTEGENTLELDQDQQEVSPTRETTTPCKDSLVNKSDSKDVQTCAETCGHVMIQTNAEKVSSGHDNRIRGSEEMGGGNDSVGIITRNREKSCHSSIDFPLKTGDLNLLFREEDSQKPFTWDANHEPIKPKIHLKPRASAESKDDLTIQVGRDHRILGSESKSQELIQIPRRRHYSANSELYVSKAAFPVLSPTQQDLAPGEENFLPLAIYEQDDTPSNSPQRREFLNQALNSKIFHADDVVGKSLGDQKQEFVIGSVSPLIAEMKLLPLTSNPNAQERLGNSAIIKNPNPEPPRIKDIFHVETELEDSLDGKDPPSFKKGLQLVPANEEAIALENRQRQQSLTVETNFLNDHESDALKTSRDRDHNKTIFDEPRTKREFLIKIIHGIAQDQKDYQWDETAVGGGSDVWYYTAIAGISETAVESQPELQQEIFDSLFPAVRCWRDGESAVKRVEVYSISSKGRNGISIQRVCEVDVSNSDDGQTLVHEGRIQEVPQFVEVTQPRPGHISDMASDPPGQQSVYIPPGDNRKESYRLSTFESFPKQTPVNVPELAKHGFVYTGFYDRVKCYFCGRTVEKWAPGDNPSDKRWHKSDCSIARGGATDNIPIGSRFTSALFSGASNATSSSFGQPMDVEPSNVQVFNGPRPRGVDVSDLTHQGGTFQMLPNTTFVIGSNSVQTHQQPLRSQSSNPPARNPPRQWRMANVISSDHKRHLTNLYLNRELDRLASFGRWPTGRPNIAPAGLARAGFFYLGDMDRTQCFSCGGVLRNWSADDDAMVEHRTHFPNCRIVAGVERRNVPVAEQAETPMELAEKYPCRFPMNPHMRSEQSRVATFDRRWPSDRTRATAQEIAEAGFFFLGERDRVKCWYCNGGLQNWEYEDIPWIEHAKWFPNCQFLLAKQGQLFVYRYLSLSPHLPRPIIGRQDGSTVDPSQATLHNGSGQSSRDRDVPQASVSRVRAPSPPPAIIDPQVELRKRRERAEKEIKESEIVKVVLAMGYDEDLVRKTLLDKLESGGAHDADSIYEGTAALLDAVMEKETELQREREEDQATSIKFPTISSTYSSFTAGSMATTGSGPSSGMYQVSGFEYVDDDDEVDLYGSIEHQPSGAVGGVTSGQRSLGNETKLSDIWKDIPQDQDSMKEFIEQKKEERLCKICFTETADMVFIPCSHMVCCMSCTEAIRHCPICRKKIVKAIKTYVK